MENLIITKFNSDYRVMLLLITLLNLNKFKITMKNSIINYIINNNDSYSIQLENILDNIRFLNEINSDQWDKNIKYRTFREKKLTNLQSKYYLDRGK